MDSGCDWEEAYPCDATGRVCHVWVAPVHTVIGPIWCRAIAFARAGLYTSPTVPTWAKIDSSVFSEGSGGISISTRVRRCVVCHHSVIIDPPFSH